MKSLSEIKKQVEKGDYSRVAEMVGMSSSTVRMVIYGKRNDWHEIQRAMTDLLDARERVEQKHAIKRAKREAKLLAG